MAIREKIVIDAAQYMRGLSGAEKAAMKFARKQDRLFKQNEQTIQSLQVEITKLKRVRDASNSTESIKKYNKAISTLERKQGELVKETNKY
ncbi:MAG TPA: hypothetical protein DD671_17085, partial [Balneolaceae bacterium]|nr:hypothetical protein [Balneolaceae bacterium]